MLAGTGVEFLGIGTFASAFFVRNSVELTVTPGVAAAAAKAAPDSLRASGDASRTDSPLHNLQGLTLTARF